MRLLAKIRSFFTKEDIGEDKPLISVVFLMSKRMELTEDRLREVATRAIGRELDETRKEGVIAADPCSFIRVDGQVYLVNNFARLYLKNVGEAVAKEKELRMKSVIEEHRAWLSIDLIRPSDPGQREKQNIYARILRIAAEFVNTDCLAVFLPETGKLVPLDATTRAALVGENAFEKLNAYREDPAISMQEDDPRLEAAAQEAKRLWPEFTAAFAEKSPDQHFFVKAPFRDGEEVEWMWLEVMSVDSNSVRGKLDNAPNTLTNIREDDELTIPVEVISDWIYLKGGRQIGGFSVAIVREGLKQ